MESDQQEYPHDLPGPYMRPERIDYLQLAKKSRVDRVLLVCAVLSIGVILLVYVIATHFFLAVALSTHIDQKQVESCMVCGLSNTNCSLLHPTLPGYVPCKLWCGAEVQGPLEQSLVDLDFVVVCFDRVPWR